jgi:hypothetical protein
MGESMNNLKVWQLLTIACLAILAGFSIGIGTERSSSQEKVESEPTKAEQFLQKVAKDTGDCKIQSYKAFVREQHKTIKSKIKQATLDGESSTYHTVNPSYDWVCKDGSRAYSFGNKSLHKRMARDLVHTFESEGWEVNYHWTTPRRTFTVSW